MMECSTVAALRPWRLYFVEYDLPMRTVIPGEDFIGFLDRIRSPELGTITWHMQTPYLESLRAIKWHSLCNGLSAARSRCPNLRVILKLREQVRNNVDEIESYVSGLIRNYDIQGLFVIIERM
jgi:hypothetical protein